jgi:2-methylcitrate dehydratase PrpD
MVQRPEAQHLMKRVVRVPRAPDHGIVKLESRVVLKLKNGQELEETVNKAHGAPGDPLSPEEITAKFHECARGVPEPQRNRVIELCGRLEDVGNLREVANAVSVANP